MLTFQAARKPNTSQNYLHKSGDSAYPTIIPNAAYSEVNERKILTTIKDRQINCYLTFKVVSEPTAQKSVPSSTLHYKEPAAAFSFHNQPKAATSLQNQPKATYFSQNQPKVVSLSQNLSFSVYLSFSSPYLSLSSLSLSLL